MLDTLNSLLEKFYSQGEEKIAFIENKRFRQKIWSIGQVKETVQKISEFHRKISISKGDKVIICAKNNPFWVSLFLSSINDGIIVVPLDLNSTEQFINEIINKTNPKAVYISQFKQFTNDKKIPIYYIEELEYDLSLKRSVDKFQSSLVSPDDILEIVYTSGSTAEPKGVIITQQNIYADIKSLLEVFQPKPNTKILSLLPLSHMLEQTIGLFVPIITSVPIVYPNTIKPNDILKSIKKDKITSITCVPAFLKLFMESIQNQAKLKNKLNIFPRPIKKMILGLIDKRLSNLDTFFVGGAALEEYIETFWESLGVYVLQGYGLTEASPVVAINTYKNHKVGSVGKLLPSVEAKINADNEIFVKGDNITPGYYNNKEASDSVFGQGWFKTGDLGAFDNEGFLFIKGRKKNVIINASGLNIYPEDIESKLNSLAEIKESVVLGIERNDDVKVTAVLLLEDSSQNISLLIQRVNRELASYQQIQDYFLWKDSDFPRTPTHKIIRQKVYEIVASKQKEEVNSKKTSSDKFILLLSRISGESEDKIHPSSNLVTDLKLDSLKRLELLSSIETEFNSFIEETEINQNTNVSHLKELIKKNIGKYPTEQNYDSWALNPFIATIRFILQEILFLLLSFFQTIEIEGKVNLKNLNLPLIIIANHTSHLDTPTILGIFPSHIRRQIIVAAAKDYFFDSGFKSFFVRLLLNAFPLDRETNIQANLLTIGYYLDNRWSILIYPEGTRSISGAMNHFKSGIGILSQEMDVSILPIKIIGNYQVLPKGKNFPRRGKVRVIINSPIHVPFKLSYAEASNFLEEQLKNIK